MCEISGYIGPHTAAPILTNALKILAYRGYCSAGYAVLTDGNITSEKLAGDTSPEELYELARKSASASTIGIAHTRWASHGEPTVRNCHPHLSKNGRVAVVHNGVIENHRKIREQLSRDGYKCVSETDTEVLAHLVERELKQGAQSLSDAVARALEHTEDKIGRAHV